MVIQREKTIAIELLLELVKEVVVFAPQVVLQMVPIEVDVLVLFGQETDMLVMETKEVVANDTVAIRAIVAGASGKLPAGTPEFYHYFPFSGRKTAEWPDRPPGTCCGKKDFSLRAWNYLQTGPVYPKIIHIFSTGGILPAEGFGRVFPRFHRPYYYYEYYIINIIIIISVSKRG